jgi:hypothetical protein
VVFPPENPGQRPISRGVPEFASIFRQTIITDMRHFLFVYLCLALASLVAVSTANAAPLQATSPEPADAPLRIAAVADTFSAVACIEQASQPPTLKQEIGKTLPKSAAGNSRPIRLARLRAVSAVSDCGAFLQPDTLQIRDVRLQI